MIRSSTGSSMPEPQHVERMMREACGMIGRWLRRVDDFDYAESGGPINAN
jgi:hypothetical protein